MMKVVAEISFDSSVSVGDLERQCLTIAHSGHAHDCEVHIEGNKLLFKIPVEEKKQTN